MEDTAELIAAAAPEPGWRGPYKKRTAAAARGGAYEIACQSGTTYHIDRFMSESAPRRLSHVNALKVIQELAADSERIVVIGHGKRRQRQRNITRRQVELCIRRGTIIEGPFMNAHGNWQVTMYRHAAGEEVSCVVVIEWSTRLLVITTF